MNKEIIAKIAIGGISAAISAGATLLITKLCNKPTVVEVVKVPESTDEPEEKTEEN